MTWDGKTPTQHRAVLPCISAALPHGTRTDSAHACLIQLIKSLVVASS